MALFQPGHAKLGGRVKGIPNKQTIALKEMILGALAAAGGEQYLLEQASANPTAFLTLVGKVLPLQVGGEDGKPIPISIVERVIIDPAATD